MIKEIKMFACECDNCGEQWIDDHTGYMAFTDEISMKNNISDDGSWYSNMKQHYCPKCWIIDENDNLVLKK